MKFKAVYDEAAEPTKLRNKSAHDQVVILLARVGDDIGWVVSDDGSEEPWTTHLTYYEPMPQLTPSEALPGDLWKYGNYGSSPAYRVLGVDLKAGVWHIVTTNAFGDYKTKDDFEIQYDSSNVTVYTRTLPDDGLTGRRSKWNLVERP